MRPDVKKRRIWANFPIAAVSVASLKTGRDIGRPTAERPHNWKEVYAEWKEKKITAVEAMKRMELKKNTFYNLVKRYEDE